MTGQDDLWEPPAPDPALVARQLAALREWLALHQLSAHEAACLLAGVLPPERRGDERDFGAWLPGRKAWGHDREAWAFIVRADIDHIETVLREAKAQHNQSPQAYLSLGAKLGFLPPWLKAAQGESECKKHLPTEALKADEDEEDAGQEKTPRQIAGSANSKVRWGANDSRKMLLGTGREAFDFLRASGFESVRRHTKGRWKGRLNRTDIVNKVLEAIREAAPDEGDIWPEPQSVKRELSNWLARDE